MKIFNISLVLILLMTLSIPAPAFSSSHGGLIDGNVGGNIDKDGAGGGGGGSAGGDGDKGDSGKGDGDSKGDGSDKGDGGNKDDNKVESKPGPAKTSDFAEMDETSSKEG